MATISHWQGIDRTSATQLYAHVETRIADLDLAITLLRMPECESDTAFAWRARVIARQTLQSVSSLLQASHPDAGQMAHLASALEELRACLVTLEDISPTREYSPRVPGAA